MEIRIKSMLIMITSSFRPIIIMIMILIEQRNINEDNSDTIQK